MEDRHPTEFSIPCIQHTHQAFFDKLMGSLKKKIPHVQAQTPTSSLPYAEWYKPSALELLIGYMDEVKDLPAAQVIGCRDHLWKQHHARMRREEPPWTMPLPELCVSRQSLDRYALKTWTSATDFANSNGEAYVWQKLTEAQPGTFYVLWKPRAGKLHCRMRCRSAAMALGPCASWSGAGLGPRSGSTWRSSWTRPSSSRMHRAGRLSSRGLRQRTHSNPLLARLARRRRRRRRARRRRRRRREECPASS